MSKRIISKKEEDTFPSLWGGQECIHLTLQKKSIALISVLLLIILVIFGFIANKDSKKQVFCQNNTGIHSGWVSAEGIDTYWVVVEGGGTEEFNKDQCSIKK